MPVDTGERWLLGPTVRLLGQYWPIAQQRSIQNIPIKMKRPISATNVTAMIATVRNTSPTGRGGHGAPRMLRSSEAQ